MLSRGRGRRRTDLCGRQSKARRGGGGWSRAVYVTHHRQTRPRRQRQTDRQTDRETEVHELSTSTRAWFNDSTATSPERRRISSIITATPCSLALTTSRHGGGVYTAGPAAWGVTFRYTQRARCKQHASSVFLHARLQSVWSLLRQIH